MLGHPRNPNWRVFDGLRSASHSQHTGRNRPCQYNSFKLCTYCYFWTKTVFHRAESRRPRFAFLMADIRGLLEEPASTWLSSAAKTCADRRSGIQCTPCPQATGRQVTPEFSGTFPLRQSPPDRRSFNLASPRKTEKAPSRGPSLSFFVGLAVPIPVVMCRQRRNGSLLLEARSDP